MVRDFKGIWIPKEIWESKELTLQEKVFLVEIQSLDNGERGCYANNNYFAEFFELSTTRVSLVIKSLIEKGFITSEINIKEGNKRTLKTSLTFIKDPHKQKLIHNNTINNTINKNIDTQILFPDNTLINKKEKVKKSSEFSPPKKEEVVEYFIQNGYTKEAGEKAFNYYNVAEWKDAKENQVRNWKQKMIAVWFKPENKISKASEGTQGFNKNDY